MSTKTLGTNSTTTLTAIPWVNSFAISSPADFATIDQLIKDDLNVAHPIIGVPNGLESAGVLYVPNRGVLRILPGDYIGVDSRGWPILLSADTIASGPWTHS